MTAVTASKAKSVEHRSDVHASVRPSVPSDTPGILARQQHRHGQLTSRTCCAMADTYNCLKRNIRHKCGCDGDNARQWKRQEKRGWKRRRGGARCRKEGKWGDSNAAGKGKGRRGEVKKNSRAERLVINKPPGYVTVNQTIHFVTL